jgi:hypothetical protein
MTTPVANKPSNHKSANLQSAPRRISTFTVSPIVSKGQLLIKSWNRRQSKLNSFRTKALKEDAVTPSPVAPAHAVHSFQDQFFQVHVESENDIQQQLTTMLNDMSQDLTQKITQLTNLLLAQVLKDDIVTPAITDIVSEQAIFNVVNLSPVDSEQAALNVVTSAPVAPSHVSTSASAVPSLATSAPAAPSPNANAAVLSTAVSANVTVSPSPPVSPAQAATTVAPKSTVSCTDTAIDVLPSCSPPKCDWDFGNFPKWDPGPPITLEGLVEVPITFNWVGCRGIDLWGGRRICTLALFRYSLKPLVFILSLTTQVQFLNQVYLLIQVCARRLSELNIQRHQRVNFTFAVLQLLDADLHSLLNSKSARDDFLVLITTIVTTNINNITNSNINNNTSINNITNSNINNNTSINNTTNTIKHQ